MKIEITASEKNFEDREPEGIEEAPYLLIYNNEDQTVLTWEGPKNSEDMEAKNWIKEQRCEEGSDGKVTKEDCYAISNEGINHFKEKRIKEDEDTSSMKK